MGAQNIYLPSNYLTLWRRSWLVNVQCWVNNGSFGNITRRTYRWWSRISIITLRFTDQWSIKTVLSKTLSPLRYRCMIRSFSTRTFWILNSVMVKITTCNMYDSKYIFIFKTNSFIITNCYALFHVDKI